MSTEYTICDACHKALCVCEFGEKDGVLALLPPHELDAAFTGSKTVFDAIRPQEYGLAIQYTTDLVDDYEVMSSITAQLAEEQREWLDWIAVHTLTDKCPNGDMGCSYCKPVYPLLDNEDDCCSECGRPYDDGDDD